MHTLLGQILMQVHACIIQEGVQESDVHREATSRHALDVGHGSHAARPGAGAHA